MLFSCFKQSNSFQNGGKGKGGNEKKEKKNPNLSLPKFCKSFLNFLLNFSLWFRNKFLLHSTLSFLELGYYD